MKEISEQEAKRAAIDIAGGHYGNSSEDFDQWREDARTCARWIIQGLVDRESESKPPLAIDVSLEKARALHRVWRALNDGDCPACHSHYPATEMYRSGGIMCPACAFKVTDAEIDEIEKLFAPAMDAAVAIFRQWRAER